MNTCIKIPHTFALAAILLFMAMASYSTQAQTTDPLLADSLDQSGFPQITAQPVDQTVPLGANVVMSVQANNADSFQWLYNGTPLDGQTNTTLAIPNATINDVGLYSCIVSLAGESVPTRAASLSVETTGSTTTTATGSTGSKLTANTLMISDASLSAASMPAGGPIIVYGTPCLGGGSKGSCPGPYVGYVVFSKSASQGWGWTPISGVAHTAADGSGRTDTKVEYVGLYGDHGCAQTSVSVSPTYSTAYRFTIYFTNNVPTNAYPIVLSGFNP